MSKATAGYSFILEFNETLVNKVVRALFSGAGVPTQFNHGEAGQSGELSSRNTATGRWSYQNYLVEGLLGYDLTVYNPRIQLFPDGPPQIALTVDFALVIMRRALLRRTGNTLEIPEDPRGIDPGTDYPVLFDSGLVPPDNSNPMRGTLGIRLNLILR
ncbi:MAG: hypothetical protein JZU55_05475, partial [Afipia sp.]|nr:hypothetical protein [Afipia sp.]